jgi:biopolymer transport protein ExbD
MTPKKKKTKGDMTPMIDCVFLLLIFFIIAAKFVTPEGHLDFWQPKDSGQSNSRPVDQEELQDVRIVVKGGPNKVIPSLSRNFTLKLDKEIIDTFDYRMREWNLAGKKLDSPGGVPNHILAKYVEQEKRLHGAFELLTKKLQTYTDRNAKVNMVISVDPEVPWIFVVEAMNACASVKLEGVKFGAQKRRLTKMYDGVIEINK